MSQRERKEFARGVEHIAKRYVELFVILEGVDLRLSPRRCADCLSLASAVELERELKRRGLPRFRVLRDWYYVVQLHKLAKGEASLSVLATRRGDYPSILYRFVQRTTGRSWSELRRLDSDSLCALAVSAWRANGLSR